MPIRYLIINSYIIHLNIFTFLMNEDQIQIYEARARFFF